MATELDVHDYDEFRLEGDKIIVDLHYQKEFLQADIDQIMRSATRWLRTVMAMKRAIDEKH